RGEEAGEAQPQRYGRSLGHEPDTMLGEDDARPRQAQAIGERSGHARGSVLVGGGRKSGPAAQNARKAAGVKDKLRREFPDLQGLFRGSGPLIAKLRTIGSIFLAYFSGTFSRSQRGVVCPLA